MPTGFQQINNPTLSIPGPSTPAPKPDLASIEKGVNDATAQTAKIAADVASLAKSYTTPNTGIVQNPNTGLYEGYVNGQRITTGTKEGVQSQVDESVNKFRTTGTTTTGTQAPQVTADSSTVTSGEKSLLDQYKQIVSEPVLDTTYIDNELAALEARRTREMQDINNQFDQLKTSQEQQQKGETGTTSLAIARAGGYLGVSGSGTGVLLNLAQSHRAEVRSLEASRQAALNEARTAFEDKQFALARQKVQDVRDYQSQIRDRQKDYFDLVKAETEKQQKKLELQQQAQITSSREAAIVGLISQGVTDPTQLYSTINFDNAGNQVGDITVDEINNVISKFKPKTTELDSFKPSGTQVAQLLGAGFGKEDIQILTDYINTNGYDDALKAKLTPYEKRVLDGIFTLKPEKSVDSTSELYKVLTPSSIKSLVDAGFDVKPGDTLAALAARMDIPEEQAAEIVQAEQQEPGFFSKIGNAIANLFNGGEKQDNIDKELQSLGL